MHKSKTYVNFDLYGINEDKSFKEFTDSYRPKTVSVSLYTLAKSENKAKILGRLEIGESYHEMFNGKIIRTITRIK